MYVGCTESTLQSKASECDQADTIYPEGKEDKPGQVPSYFYFKKDKGQTDPNCFKTRMYISFIFTSQNKTFQLPCKLRMKRSEY